MFLLCAVLPTIAVTAESFRRVSSQLAAQSDERLRAAAKWAGMAILDELIRSDHELQIVATALETHPDLAVALSERLDHFRDVLLDSGVVRVLRGDVFVPPPLTIGLRAHLSRGKAVLVVSARKTPKELYLVRGIDDDRGTLWARMEVPAVLRNVGLNLEAVPFDGLCLLSGSDPLYCSPGLAGSPWSEGVAAPAADTWRSPDGREHVARTWALFLDGSFAAPSWTLVVSEPRRSAFSAVAEFRTTMLLILLISLGTVFLVSSHQIRRTLYPLEALKRAAKRIGQGHLGEPIHIQSNDEFAELGRVFGSMSTELDAQFQTLQTLHALDRAVLTTLEEDAVVNVLLDRAGAPLGATAAAVFLVNRGGAGGVFAAATGNSAGRAVRSEPAAGALVESCLRGSDGVVLTCGETEPWLDLPPFDSSDDDRVVVSLRTGTEVFGGLIFAVPRSAASDHRGLVERARQIGDQASVAFTAARLVGELEQLSWGAMIALARAVDARSPWTAGHSERVATLSRAVAEELRLDEAQIRTLQRAALLHDVGKVGLPSSVLDKHGELTPRERAMIERHVDMGVRILEPIHVFADILPVVQDHHERLDGSGYPARKRGDAIHFLARIIAVVDVFDALVSERPYRSGVPENHVLRMLREEAGTRLDADVVAAFERVMSLALVGDIPVVENGPPGDLVYGEELIA